MWWLIQDSIEVEASNVTPCKNCGQPFNVHRGGGPHEDPATRRNCPAQYLPWPRLTYTEEQSKDYSHWDRRIAAYWSERGTYFEPTDQYREWPVYR